MFGSHFWDLDYLIYGRCSQLILASQVKYWLSGLELTKCLSEDPDQTQSDLGLRCLSRIFCKADCV